MKLPLAALLLALSTTLLHAEPYTFLTVTARDGDGMFALLRRYGLAPNSCNQRQFNALNRLAPGADLHAGSDYRVPVCVYAYNGRSIRSTLGIDDLPLARSIQSYNRAQRKAGHRAAAYERDRELWVPYSLLFCDGAIAVAAAEPAPAPGGSAAESSGPRPPAAPAEAPARPTRGYAIFGEEYARVERVDNRLRGKVFYLVGGHGGPDPGAIGEKGGNDLCEDEYAYDVVLRLARNIIAHGGVPYVIVRDPDDGIRDEEYLACDYDEEVWGGEAIPRDQRARLRQRSDAINALAASAKRRGVKDQYCVVVHVDSRHADTQTDLFFYYQRGSKRSARLTETLRATMARNYRRHGRTREYTGAVHTRDLHMLRETDVPTVYIELGNIQHAFDQKRVLRVGNRQALANWFAEGLLEHFD